MINTYVRRFGCIALIASVAAASAQQREVAPLPSLAPLVAKVAPAVVNISVTEIVEQRSTRFGGRGGSPFFEDFQDDERQAAGSGVIVDADNGYVLTNHHVVADARDIQVILSDNRSFDAAVIGSDPESDVAVLQIDATDLTAIAFASTTDLQVGDYVVAIGNPFGLGQTVTSGIVSAMDRTSGLNMDGSYEDFIQTDAAINVGNSGGALINLDGDLIGVNSAIISRTGDSVGVGFAIPAEMVVSVMQRLLEFGEVPRGLLGINAYSVTPALAADYGLSVDFGALVSFVVSDSAAAAADIRINDVITAIDGEAVADFNQLRNTVAMRLPGEEVSVDLIRDGRPRSIRTVLGAKEPVNSERPARRAAGDRPSVFTGIDLIAESDGNTGLRILAIDESASVQARQLLSQGDLITAINQRSVRSVAEAMELTQEVRNVVVKIERSAPGSADSAERLIQLR